MVAGFFDLLEDSMLAISDGSFVKSCLSLFDVDDSFLLCFSTLLDCPRSSDVDFGLRLVATDMTDAGLDAGSGGSSSSSLEDEGVSASMLVLRGSDIHTKVRVGDSCCDRSKCDDQGCVNH